MLGRTSLGRLFTLFLIIQGFVALATSNCPDENHSFYTPQEGDSRSPCPFLNTLANHGYLPRDGKGITIPQVLDACKKGFNVDPEVLGTFGKLGLLTSPNFTFFSLDQLNLHGCIETDASLSRSDNFLAPNNGNLNFNETVYSTLASSNPGVDYYNITSAGQVMKARLDDSIAKNPELVNGGREITFRSTESALYLLVMGDAKTGVAPKKFVDTIFREERFPEGWQRPEKTIDPATVGPMAMAVQNASNWEATNGSYTGALEFVIA
ncbi:Cloroperoxidase [Dendrothele bispora CBS 962.96]|uniref:Cloroperoxidase n=1 Tax=Dendrothele bispora (strain CBS 962.96) TaxID=1314807 RepID=A0A4S8MMV6_DENBC|nr:Cloroperoxidase [Dendrothele bispora CBS 962.96]